MHINSLTSSAKQIIIINSNKNKHIIKKYSLASIT